MKSEHELELTEREVEALTTMECYMRGQINADECVLGLKGLSPTEALAIADKVQQILKAQGKHLKH